MNRAITFRWVDGTTTTQIVEDDKVKQVVEALLTNQWVTLECLDGDIAIHTPHIACFTVPK